MSLRPIALTALLAGLAVLILGGVASAQGTLTPPAGAPGPTFKTLTQVEPRTPVNTLAGDATAKHIISKPGAYYLTASITGNANMIGIKITTEGVNLDLGGFELIGVPGSQNGIQVTNGKAAVYNGIIREWGTTGIFGGRFFRAENIACFRNKGEGLQVTDGALIRNSSFHENDFTGCSMGDGSIMENCSSAANSGAGISTSGNGGQVRFCAVRGNTGTGINQSNGGGWIIEQNSVLSNGSHGINAGGYNLIRANLINFNGVNALGAIAGINLRLGNNRVEDNQLHGNRYGIYAGNNPGKEYVVRNKVSASTTSNYNGFGGNNVTTFGPISTTVVGVTNPNANYSF